MRWPGRWLRVLGCAPDSVQLQVVWRLVGCAMLLLVRLTLRDDPWLASWRHYPPEFHAMTAAAAALVVFGPRLIVLLAASAAWIVLFTTINAGEHPHLRFIADEFLLFLAVPALGALSALVSALEHRPDVDPPLPRLIALAQRWHLRMCGLVALGFAALHKLNLDFFDPRLSCATVVGRKLGERWHVPIPLPSPLVVVLLELLTPVLLLLYPRLGVALALVLAVGLGHAGPYAFNTLLLALALAFLPAAAADSWSTQRRRLLVIFAPLALAAAGLSASLFRGASGWLPFLAFDLALALGLALLLVTLRREPLAARLRPRLRRPRLPGRYWHRSLCIYAALILIVDGLSPYLGLKYRYSFAMLSNLRADDSRWNSLVVPRAVRLRADPLVHVLGVYDLAGAPLKIPRSRAKLIRPGVYSPQEFRLRHEGSRRREFRATVRLRHRGVERVFVDHTRGPELQRFVDALPELRMYQDELTLDRGQRCVH